MEQITSRENPQIKRYCKLRDQKKQRSKESCFVVESAKLLEEVLLAHLTVECVYCTQKATEKYAQLLAHTSLANTPLVLITADIEEKMTQTNNANGLFAICKMLDKRPLLHTMKSGGRFLYLHQLQDSGNVGTILRTALALGLSGVVLSSDCADIYSIKVLRAAMGAVFHLPFYWSESPIDDLTLLQSSFTLYAAVVDASAMPVTTFDFAQNSMVLIGNEGNGLPHTLVKACDHAVTIAMKGQAESLNAGMAAGILMWELMK